MVRTSAEERKDTNVFCDCVIKRKCDFFDPEQGSFSLILELHVALRKYFCINYNTCFFWNK